MFTVLPDLWPWCSLSYSVKSHLSTQDKRGFVNEKLVVTVLCKLPVLWYPVTRSLYVWSYSQRGCFKQRWWHSRTNDGGGNRTRGGTVDLLSDQISLLSYLFTRTVSTKNLLVTKVGQREELGDYRRKLISSPNLTPPGREVGRTLMKVWESVTCKRGPLVTVFRYDTVISLPVGGEDTS